MTQSNPKSSNKKSTLRSLVQEVPDGEELYHILFELADPISFDFEAFGTKPKSDPNKAERTSALIDRTLAIVGLSYLELALKKSIMTHFTDKLSDEEKEKLFSVENNGSLATAFAKIKMAFALGIINEVAYEDLKSINSIRNVFAHSMKHLSFQDEKIRKECESLNILKHENFKDYAAVLPIEFTNRKFLIAICQYFHTLNFYPHIIPGGLSDMD